MTAAATTTLPKHEQLLSDLLALFVADKGLTPRQADVLRVLLGGTTQVTAIAKALKLSEHTAHNHLKAITSRCAVRSKTGLLALFLRESLTRLDHPNLRR